MAILWMGQPSAGRQTARSRPRLSQIHIQPTAFSGSQGPVLYMRSLCFLLILIVRHLLKGLVRECWPGARVLYGIRLDSGSGKSDFY